MNKQNNYIIGVGSGGCNIVNNISKELSVSTILIQTQDDMKIIDTLKKKSYLICALGGNFGSQAILEIANAFKKSNISFDIIVTLPLTFEGKHRKTTAEETIKKLTLLDVKVHVVDSNMLLANIDTEISMSDSFRIINNYIKDTITDA